MITLILTGIGAGLGALIGAAISSTETGKKINDKLEDGYDKYGKDIVNFAASQYGTEIAETVKNFIEDKS